MADVPNPSTKYLELYRRIISTHSYQAYLHILDDIEYSDISTLEKDAITTRYTQTLQDRFFPRDCRTIREIKLPVKIPGFPDLKNEYEHYYGEKAEQMCVFAKDLNMTLPEYVLRIMNVPDFEIHSTPPMTAPKNAEEAIRYINRSAKRGRLEDGDLEEEMYKEMELGIDLEKVNRQDIDEMNETVKEMGRKIEQLQDMLKNYIPTQSNVPPSVTPPPRPPRRPEPIARPPPPPRPPQPSPVGSPRIQSLKPTPARKITRVNKDIEEERRKLVDSAMRNEPEETEKIRQKLNKEQSIQDATDVLANPDTPKEISRVLDSAQYQYFLKNAHKLGLPVAYDQIARGQYQVRITIMTPVDESKALKAISDAEAHQAARTSTAKTHHEGYDRVLDILCRVYSKEAKRPCGLSKTGALSTLADRILDYAYSQGIDWQEYDIESIDLFAKEGAIYTVEQATEAFNSFISHIEGRLIRNLGTAENETECAPDTIAAYITDYDAVASIVAQNLLLMNVELRDIRDDAIKALTKCNYYPNKLEDARSIAIAFMRHNGMDYADSVQNAIDSYVRKYKETFQ